MSLAQSAITMPRGAGEIPDDDGNPLWVEIRKLSTQDILQLEIIDQHLNVEEPATTFAQKSAKEMICQQIEVYFFLIFTVISLIRIRMTARYHFRLYSNQWIPP
jgi:hypothetical protein